MQNCHLSLVEIKAKMRFIFSNRKKIICSSIAALLLTVVFAHGFKIKTKYRTRRVWVRNWILRRETFSHVNLVRELKENNPNDYRNYFRMDEASFDLLLQKIKPYITKKDTAMRQAISAEERLIATLRFLATGRSLEDLKFTTAISAQALGKIVPETCSAIYKSLHQEYMKVCIAMISISVCIYFCKI